VHSGFIAGQRSDDDERAGAQPEIFNELVQSSFGSALQLALGALS
jgi:hypothetical protein